MTTVSEPATELSTGTTAPLVHVFCGRCYPQYREFLIGNLVRTLCGLRDYVVPAVPDGPMCIVCDFISRGGTCATCGAILEARGIEIWI